MVEEIKRTIKVQNSQSAFLRPSTSISKEDLASASSMTTNRQLVEKFKFNIWFRSKVFWILLIGIILLGLLVWQYWKYRKLTQLLQIQAQSQNSQVNEADKLLAQLNQLMVLPTDEQPTIATVTSLEKLKDQPFFARSKVGDKVIIYTKSGRAILFRPEENKIIDIAPFNLPVK